MEQHPWYSSSPPATLTCWSPQIAIWRASSLLLLLVPHLRTLNPGLGLSAPKLLLLRAPAGLLPWGCLIYSPWLQLMPWVPRKQACQLLTLKFYLCISNTVPGTLDMRIYSGVIGDKLTDVLCGPLCTPMVLALLASGMLTAPYFMLLCTTLPVFVFPMFSFASRSSEILILSLGIFFLLFFPISTLQ